MLYDLLKVLHIFLASCLVLAIYQCVNLMHKDVNSAYSIMGKGLNLILPLSLLQLLLGCTLVSLKKFEYSQLWILASLGAFSVFLISWSGFTFFLLSNAKPALSTICLLLSISSILTMIFFMTNKPLYF